MYNSAAWLVGGREGMRKGKFSGGKVGGKKREEAGSGREGQEI